MVVYPATFGIVVLYRRLRGRGSSPGVSSPTVLPRTLSSPTVLSPTPPATITSLAPSAQGPEVAGPAVVGTAGTAARASTPAVQGVGIVTRPIDGATAATATIAAPRPMRGAPSGFVGGALSGPEPSLPSAQETPAKELRKPLGMRILPSRIHYGWWISIAIAAVMFATVGVGFYGLAVFLRPLQEENGWSNAAVSGASGMYFSITGLTGLAVGPSIDRRGPVKFMIFGVALVGVSGLLLSQVDQLWQLYAVYTLQAVAFGMSGSVAVNSVMSRWFITKRAKAMSISSTGVSLGGVILSPVGTWLVERGGVELAAIFMGCLVLAIGLPIVATIVVWDPAEVGLEPDGGAPDPKVDRTNLGDDVQRRVWSRAEASRTGAFWAILVAFLLVLLAQTGFLLHQIAFLTDRLGSANAAALALSTTAFGSIVARFALGQVADRLDKRWMSAALFVIQGGAVLGLLAIDNRAVTYLLVMIIGFTIGNVYMMQTLLVAEIFGLVSMGTVFGVVSLAAQIGSGLGPFLMGWLEDATGDYGLAFSLGASITIISAVIILFATPPNRAAVITDVDGEFSEIGSGNGSRALG